MDNWGVGEEWRIFVGMKTCEIIFRTPSALNDAICPDGEILDGSRFFTENESPSSPSSSADVVTSIVWEEKEIVANDVPAGARVLCLHRPNSGNDNFNILYRLLDGSLAFSQSGMPSGNIVRISEKNFIPVSFSSKQIAFVGSFVVISLSDNVFYSIWLDGCYSVPLPLPPALEMTSTVSDAPLDGYPSANGLLPRGYLNISVNSAIAEAVTAWLDGIPAPDAALSSESKKIFDSFVEKLESEVKILLQEYINKVYSSGRYIFPVATRAVVSLTDGNKILTSPISILYPEGDLSLVVSDHTISSGVLHLSLEINRPPYSPQCDISDTSLPDFMSELTEGIDIEVSDCSPDIDTTSLSSLRTISLSDGRRVRGWVPTMRPKTKVDEPFMDVDLKFNLYQRIAPAFRNTFEAGQACENPFEGTAYVRSINSRLIFFKGNRLMTTAPGNPLAYSDVCVIEGDKLLDVVTSFRSISSGQLGEFPLYAFSCDGIRALTPVGDGRFRAAQLISRDVAYPDSVVPAQSSVIFLSKQGLMNLSGTVVTKIASLSEDFNPETYRVAYDYEWNVAIICPTSGGDCMVYNLSGKDYEQNNPLHLCALFTLWPDLYAQSYSHKIVKIGAHCESVEPGEDVAAPMALDREWVFTRPLKLGSMVDAKRIYGYEISQPHLIDGSCIQGSDDMERWKTLLRSTGIHRAWAKGYRGRPWRYYRICLQLKGSKLPYAAKLTYHLI